MTLNADNQINYIFIELLSLLIRTMTSNNELQVTQPMFETYPCMIMTLTFRKWNFNDNQHTLKFSHPS